MIDGLLDALANDSMQRLRWRVLREFNTLPGSQDALSLSDKDTVLAGLNMLLDLGARTSPYSEYEYNPSFDPQLFQDACAAEDDS